MARLALALALCFVGAAHGFGNPKLPECPADALFGNVFDKSRIECDVLGEACELLIGDVLGTGMCIKYNLFGTAVSPVH